MARIRIKCRGVTEAQHGALISGTYPSLGDVEIISVHDDGREELLTAVSDVAWFGGSGNEPTFAIVKILGPEIDIETRTEGVST